MKKFRAHQGDKFTIEWYFNKQEKSGVRDYFKKLPNVIERAFERIK